MSLSLLAQESIAQLYWSKNDIQKKVHCVAKNIPFVIEVGSSSIDFNNKTRIVAKLLYDSNEDDFKPVDYVKQEPMTFRVFGAEHKVTIEFRLFCLSSQHEDSCFRIKIGVTSPQTTQPLEVMSEPIRVVSKVSQIQREKARNTPRTTQNTPNSPSSSQQLSGTKRAAPSSPTNDVIQDTLQRLEDQQREQRALIEQLIRQQQPCEQSVDFESAFFNFLTAFRSIPCEDRPSKVLKVMNSSSDSVNLLSELVMACSSSPDIDSQPTPTQLTEGCPPVVTESVDPIGTENVLEAWDLIYSDLTSSPESDTWSNTSWPPVNEQDSLL